MLNTVSSVAMVLVVSALETVTSAGTQSSTRMSLNATDNDSTVKTSKAISDNPALWNTILYHNDDCALITSSESGKEKLNVYLNNGDVKLIRYLFTVDNTTTPLNTTYSKLFRPMFWARTFSAQGLGVLQLGEMYEVYSFRLLDIGVETLEINLSQKPADCLQGKSAEDFEQMLRLAVLSELQTPSLASDGDFKVFNDSQNICNQHALTDQGMLNVSYYCCTLDKDKQLVCRYLTFTTVWMKVIFWAAMILPAIVVLFLPNYLPKSMLVSKTGVASFTYRLSDIEVLSVSRITSRDHIDEIKSHLIKHKQSIKDMEKFSETVSNFKVGTKYHLQLQDIRFKVPNDCVLTKEDMGLGDVFRRRVFECVVRNTKWYRLLEVIMNFLFAVLVFAPFLVRVAVFYIFEYDEARALEESANEHSAVVFIQNGLTVNIPPFHPVFITACSLNGINIVVYLLVGVFSKNLVYTFNSALNSCFKDMMKDMANRGRCVSKFNDFVLARCKHFRLILVPLTFVSMSPLLIMYLLPLGNVLIKLVANRANNVQGPLFKRLSQCLIVIYSVVTIAFLIYDCICFYVDIFVYTFIGFIINFNAAAPYVSVVILVMFYGQRCYGSVYEKYAAFFKALLRYCTHPSNSYLRVNVNETSVPLYFQPAFVQSKDSLLSLDVTDSLKWNIKRAPLLIRGTNEPCLLKAFYYKACNMPYENAPGFKGEPLLQYVKAMIEFILILVFLSIVMIIVFAFGDDYNLSTTNKTIATVMGGVVPFLLTTFVFKRKNTPDCDSLLKDPFFQGTVNYVMHNYEEQWQIDDIVDIPSSTRLDGQASTSFIPITDQENCYIPDARHLYILDEDRRDTILDFRSTFLTKRKDNANVDASFESRGARSSDICSFPIKSRSVGTKVVELEIMPQTGEIESIPFIDCSRSNTGSPDDNIQIEMICM